MSLLEVASVSAWYGQAQALWDVSLAVPEGQVAGVLGRNGAGKTTLLRAIAGLHPKVTGVVHMGGAVLSGARPDVIARSGLSLVREGARLPSSLSVLECLELGQRLGRVRADGARSGAVHDIAAIWRWFPILEPLRARRVALLSGGQRQALALATGFIGAPRVMLLDEPSAGLSPVVSAELFRTIGQLAGSGVAILVVEQQPAWLIGLAANAYLLELGRVVAEGSVESVIRAGDAAAAADRGSTLAGAELGAR